MKPVRMVVRFTQLFNNRFVVYVHNIQLYISTSAFCLQFKEEEVRNCYIHNLYYHPISIIDETHLCAFWAMMIENVRFSSSVICYLSCVTILFYQVDDEVLFLVL
jgi:hypothetical protein